MSKANLSKKSIISTLHSFQYPSHNYWLVTGAAMVMYGIRSSTADIDLGCDRELAERLELDGYLFGYTDTGKRWFRIPRYRIEVFEDWLEDTVTVVDGLPEISIKGLLEMKKELGREKDLRDIERIEKWMEK